MVANKKAIERLYDCTCDIYEYRQVVDENNISCQEEVLVYSNLPCRLSYATLFSSTQSRAVNYTKTSAKLFISPEVKISAGSKVKIYKNGMCIEFKNSGEPAIYNSHQEIKLDLLKNWG